jgi:hypothetical protein
MRRLTGTLRRWPCPPTSRSSCPACWVPSTGRRTGTRRVASAVDPRTSREGFADALSAHPLAGRATLW